MLTSVSVVSDVMLDATDTNLVSLDRCKYVLTNLKYVQKKVKYTRLGVYHALATH